MAPRLLPPRRTLNPPAVLDSMDPNDEMDQPQGGEETSLADAYGLNPQGNFADAQSADPEKAPAAEPMGNDAETGDGEEPTQQGSLAGGDEFAPLLEALRGQGINSFDDLHAQMLAKQSEAELQSQMQSLAQDIQSRVDAGLIDEQTAQELYNAKAQALELSAQVAAEQSKLEAAAQREAQAALAKLSPDLAKAVRSVNLTTEQIKALTPVLEKAVAGREKQSIAKYVAAKAEGESTAPIPEAGGGSPREAAIDVSKANFSDLFALDSRRR